MKLDTAPIRQLRDALIADARARREEAGLGSGPEQEAFLERVGPIAEAMYLMMMADEEKAAAERDAIHGAIRALTGDQLGADAVTSLLGRFDEALRVHGREARLQQVGSLLSADREDAEAAFALAAAVAVADGDVADAETGLIRELAEWLGISSRRAEAILQDVRS